MNAHAHPTFTPIAPGIEHIQLVPVAPAGDYTLLIDGADYISHSNGAFLRLGMHVGDGLRFGTPIVLDLHLDHSDDYVSQPAQIEFAKLMAVIGYPELLDADDLRGCCFRATIGKRQASAAHRTENYLSAVHEGAWTPFGERAEVARTRPAPIMTFPDVYGLIADEPMGDIPEGETLWFDTAEKPCKGDVVAVHARAGACTLQGSLPPYRPADGSVCRSARPQPAQSMLRPPSTCLVAARSSKPCRTWSPSTPWPLATQRSRTPMRLCLSATSAASLFGGRLDIRRQTLGY